MFFFPGKVVMVFHPRNDFGTQQTGDQSVDDVMIGGSVVPHQIHCLPIFLTGVAIHRELTGRLEEAREWKERAKRMGFLQPWRKMALERTGSGEWEYVSGDVEYRAPEAEPSSEA